MEKVKASRRRSITKAITWRIIVFIDTLVISYLVTKDLYFAGAIVGIKLFTGTFWYYIHERVWTNSKWQWGNMKSLLKIWQYALGSFSDDKTKDYDKQVLIVRTFWVLLHIATCLMIILGNGHIMGWW